MTAYELADLIDSEDTLWLEGRLSDICNMLRQQADRIAELEKQSKFQGDNKVNDEPVAWINEDNFLLGDVLNSAVYRTKPNEEFTIPLYTHPAKTLTDEEIKQLAYQHRWNGDVDFARAILRKAQKK